MYAQRGNALFLILIAVALFAALSYAITSSSRGQGNVQREQSALDASYLMQLSSRIDLALQRVSIVNGCSLDAISYDSLQGSPSTFPGSCNIYDLTVGGGAEYRELLNGSDPFYGTYTTAPPYPKGKRIYSGMDVWGTKTTAPDVVFQVFGIKQDTCKAINKQVGIVTSDGEPPLEDTPYEGGWGNPRSTALIAGNWNITIGRVSGSPVGNELTGQRVGCYRATGGGFPMGWHFYAVLIEY